MVAKAKKNRLNVIDFMIILIVIFLAVGMAFRYDLAKRISFQSNQDKFEVEFIIQDIQEYSQNYLTAGESFYVTTASIKIGEIKEILDIKPAEIFVKTQIDDAADIIESEIPLRIDVKGVLTCYGKKLDTGYMINGNIAVGTGKEFLVHTGKLEATISVISITDAEK
jgi:hypothetical protein